MTNELLLFVSLVIEYSLVVLTYKHFGKSGLFSWMAIVSVLANIEVLILISAFGLEMTLGNILFATTFLVTDILSENYGKEAAKKGAMIGILSSVFFIVLIFSWMMYIPSANDVNYQYIRAIFSSTPRVVIASLIVFAVVQFLDVYLYHQIWDLFKKKHSSDKYLWVRNIVATVLSQIVNAILYNLLAFYGTYPNQTINQIIISTIIIYIITSLSDTPFLYWARSINTSNEP